MVELYSHLLQILLFCSEDYEGCETEIFPWVRHTRDFSQGDTLNRRTSSLGRNQVIGSGCSSWYSLDRQYKAKSNDIDKQSTTNKVIEQLECNNISYDCAVENCSNK